MDSSQGNATLTADVIIEFDDNCIIVIKRGNDPFKGQWALPGGIMEEDETIEEAAIRETLEETGLQVELTRLLGVYSSPGRDPRGCFVSVVFVGKPIGGDLRAGDDAKEIIKTAEFATMNLAFDHNSIIADYIKTLHNEEVR